MHLPHFLFCLVAALISVASANPAPPRARTTTTKKVTSTTTVTVVAAPTATYTHDCSVFIQRWNYHGNLFDVTYEDHHWTNTSSRSQIWIQESPPNMQAGQYLPDRQLGSHVLRVLNVANPVQLSPFSATDTGRVTVEWGTYRGNSWDTATGCRQNLPGYGSGYERATYLCYFRCDVPFTSSGPY